MSDSRWWKSKIHVFTTLPPGLNLSNPLMRPDRDMMRHLLTGWHRKSVAQACKKWIQEVLICSPVGTQSASWERYAARINKLPFPLVSWFTMTRFPLCHLLFSLIPHYPFYFIWRNQRTGQTQRYWVNSKYRKGYPSHLSLEDSWVLRYCPKRGWQRGEDYYHWQT